MLPQYIILKILLYNYIETAKYYFIFENKIIRKKLQEILHSELYKWHYLIANYNYKPQINKALLSKDPYVVKLGKKYYTFNFRFQFNVTILGIKYGAPHFHNKYNICANKKAILVYSPEKSSNYFITLYHSNNIEQILLFYKLMLKK